MIWLLALPLVAQGLLILVDEFYFHYKRRLSTWEIWGHPLDTLTVALPIALAILSPITPKSFAIFIFLSLFSSLFVTKDEFVHAKVCTAGEHWLHSLLFLLHPMVFMSIFFLWSTGHANILIFMHLSLLVSFMIFQILYWGRPWQFLKTKQTL